jgi:hypothetical protein
MPVHATAGISIVPGSGAAPDPVARKQAWEEAHPGGTIGRNHPGQLGYTACWPGGSVAATSYASLSVLMYRLDMAEADGKCPVHGSRP